MTRILTYPRSTIWSTDIHRRTADDLYEEYKELAARLDQLEHSQYVLMQDILRYNIDLEDFQEDQQIVETALKEIQAVYHNNGAVRTPAEVSKAYQAWELSMIQKFVDLLSLGNS